jgi:hypothetical protein
MFKILKFTVLAVLGLLGMAWRIVQTIASLAPDTVQRIDAPFERRDARHTWDGKTIID